MKFFRYMVLGIMIASIFVCGCGDSNDMKNYEKLIELIKQGFVDGFETVTTDDLGISYVFNFRSETQGYCYKDLDGDGMDELLLGENGEGAWDNVIYDIFTMKEGKLVHVVAGGERNRFFLTDKGVLANEGSGGASNSFYAYYNYTANGLELLEAVIYDSFEFENEEQPWFYSTESTNAKDESVTGIDEERANEIINSYKRVEIDYIPFQ